MRTLEDGRVEHVFHQSWLNTFFTCPEQARLVMTGDYPPDDTDASAKGTAVHAAIEAVLQDLILPDEAISLAFKTYRELAAEPHFRYVKVKRESTVLSHIEGAFASWWDYVYPDLKATLWIEHPFKFLVYEDDERLIYWAGTVDYAETGRIDDWKVSQNKDKFGLQFGQDGWEQRRWAIQPTVYCDAYSQEFCTVLPEFRFVNLDVQGREPQFLPVTRERWQVDFLVDQCVNVATFVERMGTAVVWPTNDQHALCSEKWCLQWPECKGRYVSLAS